MLAAAVLRASLVDELITMTAGVAIGGDGIPALAALGLSDLADAPRLTLTSHHREGADVIASWAPQRHSPA